MLEEAAHQVDVLIAFGQGRTTSSTDSGGVQFREYIAKQQKISALYQQADQLEDEADFFDELAMLNGCAENVDEANVQALANEALQLRQRAQQLVYIIISKISLHLLTYWYMYICIEQ